MRFRWGAYALVVALAACGSSTAAASSSTTQIPPARAASCGPVGVQTLAASQLARVYIVKNEVYGCAIGTHRSYWLGAGARTLRENRVGPVVVAGKDAAYGLTGFGVDTISSQVVVRNLADGRRLHKATAGTVALAESFESVGSIVVRADGAVAWISQTSSVGHASPTFQVWRIDARGQSLLESGGSIGGRSLQRSGSQVSWRSGSTKRTATLD